MKVARAIVEASLHFDEPEVLARVSSGLGEAMKGVEIATLGPDAMLQTREAEPITASPRRAVPEA